MVRFVLLKPNTRNLIILSLVSLVIMSCNNPTSPSKGSITGTVRLLNDIGEHEFDPSDFSGIKVALYETASLDTIVINTIATNPNVGFQIDQSSEFDHRLSRCVMETDTNESGAFELSKIPYGIYNLVLMKEGWGYRYIYSLVINTQVVELDSDDLVLYPERIVNGYVNENIVLGNWRHLVVTDDTFFPPESSLEIGPNAVVRISPSKKLDLMGNLNVHSVGGSMFMVTCNDRVYTTKKWSKDDLQPYYSFNLLPSVAVNNSELSWGVFSYGLTGLSSQSDNGLTVSNCSFNSNHFGFWGVAAETTSIEASVIRSSGLNSKGILFNSIYGGYVKKNIIIGAETGLRCDSESNLQISDNVFIDNENGIQLFDSDSLIEHNIVRGGVNGIRVAGPNNPRVLYNSVTSDKDIVIGYDGNYRNSRAVVNNNNLSSDSYYYYMCDFNMYDIDARYNYHYTTNSSLIESKTYDNANYPPDTQDTVGNILYLPFSTQLNPNAGPR